MTVQARVHQALVYSYLIEHYPVACLMPDDPYALRLARGIRRALHYRYIGESWRMAYTLAGQDASVSRQTIMKYHKLCHRVVQNRPDLETDSPGIAMHDIDYLKPGYVDGNETDDRPVRRRIGKTATQAA